MVITLAGITCGMWEGSTDLNGVDLAASENNYRDNCVRHIQVSYPDATIEVIPGNGVHTQYLVNGEYVAGISDYLQAICESEYDTGSWVVES